MEKEKLDHYRRGLLARRARKQEVMETRRLAALKRAREAAQQLIRLESCRVLLFGSILVPNRFHERSDVDVLVYGLPTARWRAALVLLEDWPGLEDVVIDLKLAEDLPASFLSFVEKQGEEISLHDH